MSRRRPDHSSDMTARGDQRRLRARRRRRRMVRAVARTLFWTLVLAGVFIMGIGYGKTLSGEDELSTDEVTVAVEPSDIVATLPTKTVTVTKTVTTPAKRPRGGAAPTTPAR